MFPKIPHMGNIQFGQHFLVPDPKEILTLRTFLMGFTMLSDSHFFRTDQ